MTLHKLQCLREFVFSIYRILHNSTGYVWPAKALTDNRRHRDTIEWHLIPSRVLSKSKNCSSKTLHLRALVSSLLANHNPQ